MTESERRQILDRIARSIYQGNDPESYQASVDRLVYDGMSLELIEAEVIDRIKRIRSDDEVDGLRQSVKKKALLLGGITAVVLLVLSLGGSYLLMRYVAPIAEATPTASATPKPTDIPEHPSGHWRFSVDVREVQAVEGGTPQAIVTVYVIDQDGVPAPDGAVVQLNVETGTITPLTATTRNGSLSALYTAGSDSLSTTLTINFMNDEITREISISEAVAQVQDAPPANTPTPTVQLPTPTPEPSTPTPTSPIEITLDWSGKRSDTTIHIGYGQEINLTIRATQNGAASQGIATELVSALGLVTVSSRNGESLVTSQEGVITAILKAGESLGTDLLTPRVNEDVAGSSVIVRVLPVAKIVDASTSLRQQPVMATKYFVSVDSGNQATELYGSEFMIEGKHPCYEVSEKTSAGHSCYLVRDANGRLRWLANFGGQIELRPSDSEEKIVSAGRDAADSLDAMSPGSYVLRLSEDDRATEAEQVPILLDESGPVIAELPEGVAAKVAHENNSSVIPVEIILWVLAENVSDGGANKQLVAAASDSIVCGYRPGQPFTPSDQDVCGTLKRIDIPLSFARELSAQEMQDETDHAGNARKLAVLNAWVKRENLKPS